VKYFRESLPARVAAATTGLLSLVLVVIAFASYLNTALLVWQGLDSAMAAALPLTAQSLGEVGEHARRLGQEHWENRQLRVLDAQGNVRLGPDFLPLDMAALTEALNRGQAFATLIVENGRPNVRSGPAWWQAMTPGPMDLRVMYARWGRPDDPLVLELIAPVGETSQVLPSLLLRILLLTALGVALCGVVVWWMARAFYRPLRTVITIADEITMNTLAKRIPDQWGDTTLQHLCSVLNAMIARLQEAFEAQGRFVAAAAHELRGPLGAMRAQLEVRLRRERTPAEYKDALSVTLAETNRLTALAEYLLILARYERGTGLAVEQDVPLNPLLQQAADEVRRGTGQAIAVSAPDALALDADPVAIERVVANLIRNGVHADGAPIRVEAGAEGAEVWIRVVDQGRGIEPEAIPRLFEPFWRGDPARGRDGGIGLGLAIVKTVVDAHGGRIDVESEPGRGSVFTVRLPQRKAW
jgi:two-component system, OmpR family, sensor kinase